MPDDIVRIALPTPVPAGTVNAYLLLGPVPTLVDPGPDTTETMAALDAGIRQAGLQFTDIRQIVVTHPHVDHFGLAARVATLTAAPVLAHPRARRMLGDVDGEVRRTVRFLRHLGSKHGMPRSAADGMGAEYSRWAGLARSCDVGGWLEDGDMLMAGSGIWQVLHTPGHCTGHVSLVRSVDGTLLAGDHLLPRVPSSPVLEPPLREHEDRPRGQILYQAALARLVFLPITQVLPGHGDPFPGSAAMIAGRLRRLREKSRQTLAALANESLTAWELCRHSFPELPENAMVFGMSNIMGHLDLLCAEGLVAPVSQQLPRRFAAVQHPEEAA